MCNEYQLREISWTLKDERDRVWFFAGIWDTAKPADHDEPLTSFAFVTGELGPTFATLRPGSTPARRGF